MTTPDPTLQERIAKHAQEPQRNVLRVLRALASMTRPANADDVAQVAGLSRSQARDALSSAALEDFVQVTEEGRELLYLLHPGAAALHLAHQLAVSARVLGETRALLQSLEHFHTALSAVAAHVRGDTP